MYFESAYIPQNNPIMVKTRFNIGTSSGLSTLLCQAMFALQRLETFFFGIAMFSTTVELSMINWLLTFLYNMPHIWEWFQTTNKLLQNSIAKISSAMGRPILA
jgi:hypothetical protein